MRFYITAIACSALWWPVLWVLPEHGDYLRSLLARPPTNSGLTLGEVVGLLIASGLLTAFLFRRLITGAGTKGSLVLGATLPFLCTLWFLILLPVYGSLVRSYSFSEVLPLLFWGMLSTFVRAYVVVPVGVAIQFALRWAGRRDERGLSGVPSGT